MKTPTEPFVELDPTQPIYRQIYESIRRNILEGKTAPGTRLPASRQMAANLGVSRMTVIHAYDQLFAEGYLEGKQGSGTFVAAELPEEFLRVPKSRVEANAGAKRRKIEISAYGERVERNSKRIASHHSPTVTVPFQHSLIAVDDFPFDLWSRISQRHLKYSYKKIGGYGDAAGYLPLRKAIAHHLRSTRGVNCLDEQVIVTAGTQQAVQLIAQILLSPGDKVWLEDPCHLGTSDVMSAIGSHVSRIPVDDEGFDLDRAVRKGKSARLIYVTPSRQYPLGMTMSLQRRLSLLEWANASGTWIIEDDYDSEFRYSGRPLPSLQGLDRGERVLYVGTFSKTVFPGLRLGCVVLPPDLVEIFTAARALTDLHAPLTDQIVLAEFISEGHFERHVRRMRTLYRHRQSVLVDQAQRHLAGVLDVAASDAGMHLIGWLPKGVDDREVSKHISENGMLAAPLSRYSENKLERGGLMLGYTGFNDRQIKAGVNKLARIFADHQRT